MSDTAPSKTSVKYIYDLPYEIHRKLGLLLDPNDQWKDLGGIYMKFDVLDLDRIGKAYYRKESPTEELLKQWGNQNHTVLELFVIMNRMKQYQAMKILQPFVDEQYHRLIFEGVSRMEINLSDQLITLIELNTPNSRNATPNQSTRGPVGNLPLNNQGSATNTDRSRGALDISELGCGLPFIDYQQLKEGTNNWHRSNFLGRGGFGVVFKGIIKQTPMAIKRLEPQKGNELEFNALEAQRQQLFRELKYLNNNRHDNILPLYGYSYGEDKCCLIYQFMPNGSLDDRIQCRLGTPPLQWYVRYNIARGTARGIQFLHSRDKPLVHGDIKSANILLDQCMEPKIGDFGLAREGPTANYTHVKVSRVHGTRPYLPDEFLRGKKFSTKVDTYSFGVVLFEIATGLRAYEEKRPEKFLRDYIYNYNEEKLLEVIDPKIGPENFPLFKIMIELGKKCVVQRPKARPEMTDVSKEIDKTLGDIDSLLRASHQRMMNSIRFDPTVRRQSLIPATGSYHPEPWMFATPPGSIPMSIQPPQVPNRQSPSPTNPGVTVPGLPGVSEENPNENTSNARFEFRTPTIEPSVQNFQGVPNIVFTPADNSVRNGNSARQIISTSSSINDTDISSFTDQSAEQQPVHIRSEIEMDSSDDSYLPIVSLLQKRD